MLRISNLGFSYSNKAVFEGLSLSFSDPEIVAVIGDNGAGKSTLLKLIAGELRPDEGVVKTSGDVGFLHQTQEGLDEKSGGERMQIRLAEILRERPRVLLLDEPTNNLDTDSKRWLADNLRKYHGLVMMVSHDRDFINAVAEKVLYLHGGMAEIFAGNYVDFEAVQAQRLHNQTLNYESIQREKKKLRQQLKIAGDQAHKSNRRAYNKVDDESKLRFNGRRMGAQNSAGKILRATKSKLEQLSDAKKPETRKTYRAEIDSELSHKRRILEVENLSKNYGNKSLFDDLNFEIWTAERVRIVGRNGAGKSTLFRIILGDDRADSGNVKIAPGVSVGYISQDLTGLDMNKSFAEQNPNFDKTEIYRAAAMMDLSPVEMNQSVRELSRGQQTKLMILKLILRPLALVIIDEITNHLDIRARENIERALENYRGAILLASHDETFVRKIKMEREIKLS